MNSTSCILLITLLVIVVVGVCMSHPAGKAGFTPKPKSNCQTDQDCPGYDGSSETMCISNSFINGVNVCTPKCVGTDPESCGFKGRCESVMPFTDGKFTYYYCNAKDKKHPCTESCYNANPL